MKWTIVTALTGLLTATASIAVTLKTEGSVAARGSGSPDRRGSLAWRLAREAVFGGHAATDAPRPQVAHPAPEPARCALTNPASDAVSTAACVACHRSLDFHGHPVSTDYGAAHARSRGGLRPLEEVIQRGVFLPGGMVECTTCHDARSPWAQHIALPPGATPRPAVDARKPETYENRPNWRIPTHAPGFALKPGSAVSPAPLCAACHPVAD